MTNRGAWFTNGTGGPHGVKLRNLPKETYFKCGPSDLPFPRSKCEACVYSEESMQNQGLNEAFYIIYQGGRETFLWLT